MNLHLSTGFSYELFSGWQVGLSYGYLRNVETVGFGIYGTTDRQYTSLISFGGSTGAVRCLVKVDIPRTRHPCLLKRMK